MVFTTGYQANLGVMSTLVGRGDHLILDADSHASIYDGCAPGARPRSSASGTTTRRPLQAPAPARATSPATG